MPDLAPVLWRRSIGTPSNIPPTTPACSRNSWTIEALKSWIWFDTAATVTAPTVPDATGTVASMASHGPVLQLRVVVEAEDFDRALAFYRDVLGLPEEAAFEGDGDARVVILDAGRATLELANPAQRRMIDAVEVGRDVSPPIRLAFEVTDATAATAALAAAGATVIAAPVETPWRSLNARLAGPAGLQLTLFEELDSPVDRAARDGFGTAAAREGDD